MNSCRDCEHFAEEPRGGYWGECRAGLPAVHADGLRPWPEVESGDGCQHYNPLDGPGRLYEAPEAQSAH